MLSVPRREGIDRTLDYTSGIGSVDGTTGGAMWLEELDRKMQAYQIQKAYKLHRKEMDDVAPNLLPRETLAERRARLEALARPLAIMDAERA